MTGKDRGRKIHIGVVIWQTARQFRGAFCTYRRSTVFLGDRAQIRAMAITKTRDILTLIFCPLIGIYDGVDRRRLGIPNSRDMGSILC